MATLQHLRRCAAAPLNKPMSHPSVRYCVAVRQHRITPARFCQQCSSTLRDCCGMRGTLRTRRAALALYETRAADHCARFEVALCARAARRGPACKHVDDSDPIVPQLWDCPAGISDTTHATHRAARSPHAPSLAGADACACAPPPVQVPAFDEVVLPLVTQLLAEGSPSQQAAKAIWEARTSAMDLVESFVKSPLAPAAAETELLPLAKQALELVEQLPPLFQQVADGAREFTPTPDEVEEVVRRMYRARRTLVVRFDNDSIDESEEVREVIQAGKTLLRMRRPMVDMDLRYEVLTGNHITPLTQDIFTPPQPLAGPLPDACPIRQRARQDFLRTVNDLGQVLVEWLEEGLSMTSAYNPQ
eukprot:TRINITY_DN2287_c0_g1_i2.p1 TRINITY_DN2287_c0_g1~~TRINITY_DN2287_c0_g1_i2.p1  ORF type:complete len:361 (-),score=94.58 TRINITY_DN2287_c0_g1_i2:178-1260(-)